MSPPPNIDAYPKTIALRDGTEVELRPLEKGDNARLLRFFQGVPEADRYYLKEDVIAPAVIRNWTANIDYERVIPIVAVTGGQIVADATLHRSRVPARQHIGEVRIVVDPDYRDRGLGRRLIWEMLDIAAELGLNKLTFELAAQMEKPAVLAALSVGFQEVASLRGWIRDQQGDYQDLVLMELHLEEHRKWGRF